MSQIQRHSRPAKLRPKLVTALVMGLASALAVSAPAAAQQAKGKNIAYLDTIPVVQFVATMSKTFVDRAQSLGMVVTTSSQNFDPAVQSQQVDDAIARKADMIVVMPASEQAIIPALTRAKQAGIPVVVINSPAKEGSEDLYVTVVSEDFVEMGRLAAQAIEEALHKAGRDAAKVALVTGSLQEGVGPRRLQGIKEVLGKNPKIQIVAVEDVQWRTDLAEKAAGQLLARFAGQGGIDVAYGMADNVAVGIIHAAEAANVPLGLEKGKLIVVGGNCMKEGINAIKDGKMYSTESQIPTRTGTVTADVVAEYFAGKKPAKWTKLPVEIITKDNVAKWETPCSF